MNVDLLLKAILVEKCECFFPVGWIRFLILHQAQQFAEWFTRTTV
jgi:hypothetical protein